MKRVRLSHDEIRSALEHCYQSLHLEGRREADSIALVYRYSDSTDREVVAFLSALLAYGNVKIIQKSIARVLEPMGNNPRRWVERYRGESAWKGFRHRFTTEEDIRTVVFWLKSALKDHGSLEAYFCAGQDLQLPMRELLSNFVNRFTGQRLPPAIQRFQAARARNLKYLISDPLRGSACKRLNMFLRWVVRGPDAVDLGLWKSLKTHQLMLPVDTHLLKVLKALAWTKSESANWKVVEAATEKLRLFAPDDPIRYDFALCHLGMTGGSIAPLER